jgi:hypothetical protein
MNSFVEIGDFFTRGKFRLDMTNQVRSPAQLGSQSTSFTRNRRPGEFKTPFGGRLLVTNVCSNLFEQKPPEFFRTKFSAPNACFRAIFLVQRIGGTIEILNLLKASMFDWSIGNLEGKTLCKNTFLNGAIYYMGTILRGSTKPIFNTQNRVEIS